MSLLVLAALIPLGQAPRDDGAARKVFEDFSARLQKAETVEVEFKVTGDTGSVQGAFRLKSGNRWTLDFESTRDSDKGESLKIAAVCDGRRALAPSGSQAVLAPASVAAELRKALVSAMIYPYVVASSRGHGAPTVEAPRAQDVRDGGIEMLDGKPFRIVEYDVKLGQVFRARTWIDPATLTLLKRNVTLPNEEFRMEETYSRFRIDAPLDDAMFVYANARRMAQACARRLAHSAGLLGRFGGGAIERLEDLVERPAGLAPGVVWPAGGFVLGGALPRDPWGHPFVVRRDGPRRAIVSLGADGKEGGADDAEDIAVDVAPPLRMPITPPNDRLRRQYEARLSLHLVAAAVQAYRETYGERPKKKADLWERPEGTAVWPEGGWLPGARMPVDPWGDELRLITDAAVVRVQVQDPRARLLTAASLTDAERDALDAGARPVLTESERTAVDVLVRRLHDDDLETREKAQAELAAWGTVVEAALLRHAEQSKDPEVVQRLGEVRRSLPRPVAPWRAELAGLVVHVSADGRPGSLSSNERNGSMTLKTFASAQADFRANDRDGNFVVDFWTGDVAGLYALQSAEGQSIKLIELSAALADEAPLEKGDAMGRIPDLATFGVRGPKAGYLFRAMTHDNSENPPEPYRQQTGGKPELGKVHHTSKFGISAYPAEYGTTGVRTFIINENNTVFWKDTQGEPVLEWPSDAEVKAGWRKLD